MMVMGAVCGFGAAYVTGSPYVGVVASLAAGTGLALLFAVLTQTLLANQVAAGLALTLLGLGLSGLIGEAFVGVPGTKVEKLIVPFLSDMPFIGRILFAQDLIVYFSFLLTAVVSYTLFRTRLGLIIRAIGNNHHSAHALGYGVIGVRYLCILFGGACAGLAGGYLSLAYTPQWIENMTAGRGWIALALVVFAAWRPWRAFFGAYLFGGITIVQLHSQALGIGIEPQLLAMLPYLATIIVLVLISYDRARARLNAPANLGQTFFAST